MKNLIFIPLIFVLLGCQPSSVELRILQFNIWQEGRVVPDGYDAVVDEIVRLDPDFVTLSEVGGPNAKFMGRIVKSLANEGKTYYTFFTDGSGLLSRYPITDSTTVYHGKGSIYRLAADVHGQTVCVYTAHLDYQHYAVYLPRGYDGTDWYKLAAPITDVDSIMANNLESQRDEAITPFIESARKDIAAGRLVFIGGDFNEASHLDWTEATKDLYDHNGTVVPWTCSTMLYEAGFLDSFREYFPDPVTHPGFTFPADNPAVEVKKLAWAPDADERERIDFIYYYPSPDLSLVNSAVVGPRGSIIRNQRMPETSLDIFIEPAGIWPTDHKAVMSTFRIK